MTEHKIISRRDAKNLGLKFYYTGKPCKYGHITERFVSSETCQQCSSERSAHKHAANRDVNIKRSRDRYWGGARDHDREMAKAYYASHRDHYLDYAKSYRENNPDKVREANKSSWQKNREKYIEYNKKWAADHPEERRATKNKRRAAKLNNGGSHTAEDVVDIRRLQKDKCAMTNCRVKLDGKGHLDHIIALSKGGSNDRRNLQLLCPSCNLKKRAKDPLDFAREQGLLL